MVLISNFKSCHQDTKTPNETQKKCLVKFVVLVLWWPDLFWN